MQLLFFSGLLMFWNVHVFHAYQGHNRNIALHKQTRMTPGPFCPKCNIYDTDCEPCPGNNGYWCKQFCHTASLAVNNNTNPNVNKHHCAHTVDSKTQNASWSVNFNGSYYLSSIKIFNRDDGGQDAYTGKPQHLRDRLKGFSVFGLPQEETIYTNIEPDRSYRNATIEIPIHGPAKFRTFTGIKIVLFPRGDNPTLLTLCEVQVFEDWLSMEIDNMKYLSQQYKDRLATRASMCAVPQLNNGTVTWSQSQSHSQALSNVVPEGAKLILQCDKGYTLNTKSELSCQANELLDTALAPHCSAVVCGKLPDYHELSNGHWYGPKNDCLSYQCIYAYLCNPGYHATGIRNAIAVCNETGQWSKTEGSCKAMSCMKDLPFLPHGAWSSSNGKQNCSYFKCRYDFICKTGYRADEIISTSCNASGSWTQPTGKCKAIPCSKLLPRLTNGAWISSTGNLHCYFFKCQYAFRCQVGYTMSKNITTACNESGLWTQPTGTCKEITCSSPNDIANGQYFLHRSGGIKDSNRRISNKEIFSVDTALSVKCNSGYMLQNNSMSYRYCKDDTSWSNMDPECIAIEHTNSKDTAASDKAGVIGGTVGGVCAVLVAVFVVIFIIRRKGWNFLHQGKSQKTKMKAFRDGADHYENPTGIETQDNSGYSEVQDISCVALNNASPTSVKEETDMSKVEIEHNDNQHNYYNFDAVEKRSPSAIMLEDLGNYVMPGKVTMAKLEAQYSNLPTGLLHNHNAALKPENARKNRYKGIYAFDDNRVVLEKGQQKADTDYVNASYINGFDSARAYIAAQGTTKDTLGDFWRMVWQVNCAKIVMLTNLREENKMKCIQYWPDAGNQQFGEFTVRLSEAESFSDFVLRALEIKKASSDVRVVHQFHFTAWPDRGVPKFSSSLVNFRNKVRRTKTTGKGPIVVHCSAGIGRTGTYIALDILAEQGKVLGYVDIAGCVATLRQQRVNMVQNPDQYVFLHSALTEALMLSSSATSAATFQDSYRELLQFDTVQRKRNIEVAFDMLKHMSPVPDETQYVSAREVRNKRKNRYSNILPECMPVIFGSGNDGYINAVYLPSYKDRKALILTQMPLKNTKEDFWALVQEHSVHTIVMLNTIEEVEKDEIYWPEVGESQTFNENEVECIGEESIGQHSLLELQMSKGNTDRTVEQVQCKYWPASEALPSSPSDIITTIELVQTLQQKSGNHPIVVHCMNGVDRSGLFCVLWAVIERLRIEQDVAISQVIEQMRSCRDQLIPSVEQFQFCHEVIQTYIHQFSEYSNFSAI